MKNSFSYSGAVLWNSLPWREKLNIWVNLNDWLIRISDFFFKYCVHGIHEKQVLVRLVVDSFSRLWPKIRGSGRVTAGSVMWPKYGTGFGKTQNILAGNGICVLPRKRDSPKFGHRMRDFSLSVGNSGNHDDSNTRSSGKCDVTRIAFSVSPFNWANCCI